jgi:hypothetical protein
LTITTIDQISALPFVESDQKSKFYNIVLSRRFVFSLFILIALVTGVKQYTRGSYNNYKIFKHTFLHSLILMNMEIQSMDPYKIAGFKLLHIYLQVSLLCAHEALVAMLSFQFNVGLTGLIMLSFSYLHNGKEVKSAFAIALGTLIWFMVQN